MRAIISSIDGAERGARLWGESSIETKLPSWLYWREDMAVMVVRAVCLLVCERVLCGEAEGD